MNLDLKPKDTVSLIMSGGRVWWPQTSLDRIIKDFLYYRCFTSARCIYLHIQALCSRLPSVCVMTSMSRSIRPAPSALTAASHPLHQFTVRRQTAPQAESYCYSFFVWVCKKKKKPHFHKYGSFKRDNRVSEGIKGNKEKKRISPLWRADMTAIILVWWPIIDSFSQFVFVQSTGFQSVSEVLPP